MEDAQRQARRQGRSRRTQRELDARGATELSRRQWRAKLHAERAAMTGQQQAQARQSQQAPPHEDQKQQEETWWALAWRPVRGLKFCTACGVHDRDYKAAINIGRCGHGRARPAWLCRPAPKQAAAAHPAT
jgi:hypothetical protein